MPFADRLNKGSIWREPRNRVARFNPQRIRDRVGITARGLRQKIKTRFGGMRQKRGGLLDR